MKHNLNSSESMEAEKILICIADELFIELLGGFSSILPNDLQRKTLESLRESISFSRLTSDAVLICNEFYINTLQKFPINSKCLLIKKSCNLTNRLRAFRNIEI